MYPKNYYRRPRRSNNFLPFFSLILIGLIVVLVFEIVSYFREQRQQALENKAVVEILTGRAEMKIWGIDQWAVAASGSTLHEGDEVRTFPGSRVLLTLLNGSVVRINSDTLVEVTGLQTTEGIDDISLKLKNGEIWLRRSSDETVQTHMRVATDHLEANSTGTIFNVTRDTNESVRVIDGKVSVAVRVSEPDDAEKTRIAETIDVALGQEVSVGENDIEEIQQRKTIPLLALLSDSFRDGDWYQWNRAQDEKPSIALSAQNIVVVAPVEVGTSTPPAEVVSASLTTDGLGALPEAVLTAPVITAPAVESRITKEPIVTIQGTVSTLTTKLEVTTYLGGKAEPYILQKYKTGSPTWSYIASRDLGNFVSGKNRFTFTAIDADGKRSNPTDIFITYDQPRGPVDLSAPAAVSLNGTKTFETTDDVARVDGTIGKGIVKVMVNDFPLSKYVPDSGTWVYFAKAAYGNLNEGANLFEVYGISYDGQKTPITKFTITKNPKPVEAGSGTPAL